MMKPALAETEIQGVVETFAYRLCDFAMVHPASFGLRITQVIAA